jgi:cell division protein FtsB
MAIRAIQVTLRGRWRSSTRFIALAVCGLGVVGCANLGELRADLMRLRADLQAQQTAMASLAERVNAIERGTATSNGGAGPTARELQQAVDVLLKKALALDLRVAQLETAKPAAPRSEKERRPPPPPMQSRGNAVDDPKRINLGMTQEDVRRILGDPVRTEYAERYIFWLYSPASDQKYVVFERQDGRVSGWVGL